MRNAEDPVAKALSLMQQALALLDRTDETEAAAKLQHAVSILAREPVQSNDD